LEGFTFVLITHYSTNKQDESDFNQAINNFTNGMEKIQYYLDKIHVISRCLEIVTLGVKIGGMGLHSATITPYVNII
jgi:hypothetical protein